MWNKKSSVMVLPLCWWCVLAGRLTDSWLSWDTTGVGRGCPMFDFKIWEGGGWIGGRRGAGCVGRCWIWFCLDEHSFSVGTFFQDPLNCCIVLGGLGLLLEDVHELADGIRCHARWWDDA